MTTYQKLLQPSRAAVLRNITFCRFRLLCFVGGNQDMMFSFFVDMTLSHLVTNKWEMMSLKEQLLRGRIS